MDGVKVSLSQLNSPYNLYINKFGDIFFTENVLQQVYRISKSTGLIELYAGDGGVMSAKDGLEAKKASLISPMGIVGKRSINYSGDGVFVNLSFLFVFFRR